MARCLPVPESVARFQLSAEACVKIPGLMFEGITI